MRVLPLGELLRQVRRLRRQGKRIAFTNGCFDLLHVGHLSYLERVKAAADVLVVGVNSDASVRRLKGARRPVVPARERAALVAGLKPVDFVTLFPEPTPRRLICAIRPALLAKGGDWKGKEIAGAKEVRSWGGRVLILPYLKGHSTTAILRRVNG